MKKRNNFNDIQLKHFEKNENQYNPNLILKQPLHTKLEIEEIIKLIPKLSEKEQIVDFGAGTGRLTIPLAQKGYKVVAVDISPKSLVSLKNVANDLKLIISTSTKLKKLNFYQVITGCDILHHINIESSLKSINKNLKKGGVVIFSEPGVYNPSWYLYFFAKRIWLVEKGLVNCSYFNLQKLLISTGFNNIEIKGLGILPRVFFQNESLCRFNDWLGNLPILKLFAYRYIIKAYKV